MRHRIQAGEMASLNAAVAAFAHRAISERNPQLLAAEALSHVAAGLEADLVELFVLSADGQTLELKQQFPRRSDSVSESLPARGSSIAAEALARGGGVVVRTIENGRYAAATAVRFESNTCVFAALARQPQFVEAARAGLDAIAAMYASAMARCHAESLVNDRERRLQLILDQIPAIVTTLDTDLVFTSAQGAIVTEIRGKMIVGRTLEEVAGGGADSPPMQSARRILGGASTGYEWSWNGHIFDSRMEPMRDGEGRICGIVNLSVDVTEKRRAETALRESREVLRRLSAAMHEIQENERRRIAREIHDDLGQRLTALRLDLGLLRSQLREGCAGEAVQRTAAMIELVDETINTARRLARELRPAILDDLGFGAALEHEADSFGRRTGIDVALQLDPEEMVVEPARATALYRVIQEALTNVARHAGATRVEVRVEKTGGCIVAEVRDNGRGIAPLELNDPHALGLIGIRERIFAFDGSVTIEPVEGGGTRVLVSVPDEDSDSG